MTTILQVFIKLDRFMMSLLAMPTSALLVKRNMSPEILQNPEDFSI